MELGNKLKLLRNLKGYTQEQVATKLHISTKAYGNLEANKTKIDYARLDDIAKIYNITPQDILELQEAQVFTNCFNNNNVGFFSAKNVTTHNPEELKTIVAQFDKLINLISEERRIFLDIITKMDKK